MPGGRLEIIIGCMFSGKSSELVRRLKRQRAVGKKVLLINSKKDTRDFQIHNSGEGQAFECVKTETLLELVGSIQFKNAEVVAVDESQFFKGLRNFVVLALRCNKHVILAGLDGDFKQEIFGELVYMIPLADEVTKLTALCMECGDGCTPGPFSKRICDSGVQELVGAADMYKAVCRKHL
jgi:thymidine kinase